MNGAQRFLAACARRPVDRTPVWMMRQAGRYLPEYRAVRARVSFAELCRTPALASEVSLHPVERFGMDACVIFSDIMVAVEALGCPVTYADGGPVLAAPVRTTADVDRIDVPSDAAAALPFVMETLRVTRRALDVDGRAALVGFVGGPFTLASYMVEGSGSRSFTTIKRLLYAEPSVAHELLAKIAQFVAAYAAAQVRAGAQAVQVFDTWAGELAPDAYESFALPYQHEVLEAIRRAGAPAMLFVNGCAGKLGCIARSGADVASIDWRVDLASARSALGDSMAVQGNVDPCVLLSTPPSVTAAARAAMASAGPVGHILNLGHGILPATPVECAQAFVDAPKAAVSV